MADWNHTTLRQVYSTFAKGFNAVWIDSIFRRVLTNSGWLLGAQTIALSLSFIQGIIVARILGAELFGVFALITTFTSTVNQFLDSRVWETAIKFVTQYRERGEYEHAAAVVKLCYLVDTVSGLVGFIVVIAISDIGARYLIKDPSMAGLIRLYALSVLLTIPVGTSNALLRVGDRYRWLAYQNAAMAGLKLVGVIVALSLGTGIEGLLIVYLLTAGGTMVILFILSQRDAGTLGVAQWPRSRLRLLRGDFRQIVRFLITTNANATFKLLQRNADVLLIGYWLTPVDVGYYRLARSVTDLMGFPIEPLYTVSYPEFTRLWHQWDMSKLRQLVMRLTTISTSISVIALAGIWIGGAWIIQLMVGSQYLPALQVLNWLALGVALAVCTSFGHPLLLAMGRASNSLLALVSGVTGQMILLMILLPQYGIWSAGLAYLVMYIIWCVIVIAGTKPVWRYKKIEPIVG